MAIGIGSCDTYAVGLERPCALLAFQQTALTRAHPILKNGAMRSGLQAALDQRHLSIVLQYPQTAAGDGGASRRRGNDRKREHAPRWRTLDGGSARLACAGGCSLCRRRSAGTSHYAAEAVRANPIFGTEIEHQHADRSGVLRQDRP